MQFPISLSCDYDPTLHRFWDTATYWLKIAYFFCPLSFGSIAPYMFPLESGIANTALCICWRAVKIAVWMVGFIVSTSPLNWCHCRGSLFEVQRLNLMRVMSTNAQRNATPKASRVMTWNQPPVFIVSSSSFMICLLRWCAWLNEPQLGFCVIKIFR